MYLYIVKFCGNDGNDTFLCSYIGFFGAGGGLFRVAVWLDGKI